MVNRLCFFYCRLRRHNRPNATTGQMPQQANATTGKCHNRPWQEYGRSTMSIGASKSSIARSNDVALSIPEFDVRNFWREALTMSRVRLMPQHAKCHNRLMPQQANATTGLGRSTAGVLLPRGSRGRLHGSLKS